LKGLRFPKYASPDRNGKREQDDLVKVDITAQVLRKLPHLLGGDQSRQYPEKHGMEFLGDGLHP